MTQHYGNSQILDFGPQSLQALSRKLRCAIGLLHGRFGLALPRRVPIYMACGAPIPVRKVAKVRRFVARMRACARACARARSYCCLPACACACAIVWVCVSHGMWAQVVRL